VVYAVVEVNIADRCICLLYPSCSMLCTSGFVDDVMFSHKTRYDTVYLRALKRWRHDQLNL